MSKAYTYSSRRLNWKEGEFTTGYLCDGNYYFKILEDEETIDIDEIEELEPVDAYKLIESPYMAEKLKESNYDIFMELLKQSELELVDNITKIIRQQNKITRYLKQINKLEER